MKILYVRINDKIGESVIETCFYRELKRAFPQAYLTVLCCGSETILRTIPYIDELILLPPAGWRKFAAAFGKIPFFWKQNYDVLISCSPHWRMHFFNAFIRAKRKIPFAIPSDTPIASAHIEVIKKMGVTVQNTSYELSLPSAARQAAADFLASKGLSRKPFVFFNPAGNSPRRTLTPARVSEILRALNTLPVLLCNTTGGYRAENPAVIMWNHSDLLQTAALVEQAAYVITVDTSIAHIAETFHKPMTVLFSLKNYDNEPAKNLSLLTTWGPRGSHVKRLWAEKSVNDISPEHIAAATLEGWSPASKQP